VYDFVLAHQARRIYATKGFAGRSGEPIVGKPSEKRYGRSPRPVRLYPVNVDDAKADVVSSLALLEPGPGSTHFPLHVDTIDEEYFAQLCAEHRETRRNKLGVATHMVWVVDRERNEALDTAVLCLAARKLLNPNIRQMSEQLASIPSIRRVAGAASMAWCAPSSSWWSARSGSIARPR
jgi:phage terminase large subunit GpA-like protein